MIVRVKQHQGGMVSRDTQGFIVNPWVGVSHNRVNPWVDVSHNRVVTWLVLYWMPDLSRQV